MSGLAPATVTMIYLYGATSAAALLTALVVTFRGWPQPWARRRARAVLSFLERVAMAGGTLVKRFPRDVNEGLLNVVEWIFYGTRASSVDTSQSRL